MDAETKARFDRIDEGFDGVERRIEEGINSLAALVEKHLTAHDHRFDDHDRRFDELATRVGTLETRVDAGFASVEARFGATDEHLLSAGERSKQVEARVEHLKDRFAATLGNLEAQVALLDSDVTERLEMIAAGGNPSTLDLLRFRLDLLADRVERLATDVLARLDKVEVAVLDVGARLDTVSDEMRQRFRVVNDRLADIDRRLAA